MTAEAPAHPDHFGNGTGPRPGTAANGTASNGTAADGGSASPTGRIRASDMERAAVVDVLQDAVARGLLTHDEGGERMATALAATFRDQLPPLTADLPPAPPPAQSGAPGWRRLGSSAVTQVRSDLRAAAAAGPRSRRFLVTALVVLLAIGFLIAMISLALHGLTDGGYDGHGSAGEVFHGDGFHGDGLGHHGFDPH
jgi:hypothetical protein